MRGKRWRNLILLVVGVLCALAIPGIINGVKATAKIGSLKAAAGRTPLPANVSPDQTGNPAVDTIPWSYQHTRAWYRVELHPGSAWQGLDWCGETLDHGGSRGIGWAWGHQGQTGVVFIGVDELSTASSSNGAETGVMILIAPKNRCDPAAPSTALARQDAQVAALFDWLSIVRPAYLNASLQATNVQWDVRETLSDPLLTLPGSALADAGNPCPAFAATVDALSKVSGPPLVAAAPSYAAAISALKNASADCTAATLSSTQVQLHAFEHQFAAAKADLTSAGTAIQSVTGEPPDFLSFPL